MAPKKWEIGHIFQGLALSSMVEWGSLAEDLNLVDIDYVPFPQAYMTESTLAWSWAFKHEQTCIVLILKFNW